MTTLNNNSLYKRYLNILNFLSNPEFRNYNLISKKLIMKEFIKNIIINEYIRIIAKDTKKNINIYVYIFNIQSKYIRGLVKFKTLVSTRNLNIQGDKKIILISKKKINNKIKKHLISLNLPFEDIKLKYFVSDISKGPLVPVYNKLNKTEEIQFLKKNHIKDKFSLPKILISDPQVIYRGATIGEIFEIHDISLISESIIRYRIVWENL